MKVVSLPTTGRTKMAMISLPMTGRTKESIQERWNAAAAHLREQGYVVVDTIHVDEVATPEEAMAQGVKEYSLMCLGEVLTLMSTCDAVYFCNGWMDSRGCKIEYEAAKAYGRELLFEREHMRTNESLD